MSRHPEYDDILRKYIKKGRLAAWPRTRERRAVLLDFLAQTFEPGVEYPERAINEGLKVFHDDYAMLRRYLVDEASWNATTASTNAPAEPGHSTDCYDARRNKPETVGTREG